MALSAKSRVLAVKKGLLKAPGASGGMTSKGHAVAVKAGLLKGPNSGGGSSTTGGVPSYTPKAYDPTTLNFKNQQDFEDYVRTQAQASLQPQLDAINQNAAMDASTHATRENELKGWAGWESDVLGKALQEANTASNNLIAQTHAAGEDSSANLAAALGGNSAAQAQLAQQLHGAPPPSQDAALLSAAARIGQAGDAEATGLGGGLTSEALSGVSMAPVQARQLDTQEGNRLRALNDQTKVNRTNVMNQLPGAEDSARQALIQLLQGNKQIADTEQNQQFQQYLAQAQFDDQVKNEGFNRWLQRQQQGLAEDQFKHTVAQDQRNYNLSVEQLHHQVNQDFKTNKLNWAQLKFDKHKLQVDTNAILHDAETKKNDQKAQLRGKQWIQGMDTLNSYINGFQANTTTALVDPKSGAIVPAGTAGGIQVQVKTDKNGKIIYQDTGNTIPQVAVIHYPHWADAVRILTGQVRMSKHDAYLMLSASQFPSWRAKANALLHPVKKKPQPGPPSSTNAGGSPAHTGAGYP